jgi:hypothetical protein
MTSGARRLTASATMPAPYSSAACTYRTGVAPTFGETMTKPPPLTNLMADPGELELWCLDCHHHATMPVVALLLRYAPETPFPDAG